MQSLQYKSFQVPLKQTKEHDFLILNEILADICFVFERLIYQTMELNSYILIENRHYVKINGELYWSRFGVVRLCMLLQNMESMEFADFIEQNLLSL